MKKIGLFFGGIGNEHDISVASAINIIKNINVTKYEIVLLYWSRQGIFYKLDDISQITNPQEHQRIFFEEIKQYIHIALPMTHGKYGEDGVLQGLFEWQKIPYCGCRVLGSAIGMDKGLFKELMSLHHIKQTKFQILDFSSLSETEFENAYTHIKNTFSLPLYVKPANSGSSIGITKVEEITTLLQAIGEAKKHDHKVLVEEGLLSPQEIEVAILGNKDLIVSEPGELVLVKEFYSYDAKYKNNETQIRIPANLSETDKHSIQTLAKRIYKLSECCGFARIDFFLSKGEIYINEINTLPGFTDISMFPLLMKQRGMSYAELIDKIITLAY